MTQAMADDLHDLAGWKALVAEPPPMVEAAMQVTLASACAGKTCTSTFS